MLQPLSMKNETPTPGEFSQGFRAMLPLWSAALPAALAYVVAAAAAAIPPVETMLLSLLVYSGPGQIALIGMLAAGASTGSVVIGVLALHLHYLLLGITLGRRTRFSGGRRLLAAMLLTDGATVVSNAREHLTVWFYLGAGSSMYLAWNAATLLSLLAGKALLPLLDPMLDLIVPMVLVTVLASIIRSRAELLAASSASLVSILMAPILPGGFGILAAALSACLITAFRQKEHKA